LLLFLSDEGAEGCERMGDKEPHFADGIGQEGTSDQGEEKLVHRLLS